MNPDIMTEALQQIIASAVTKAQQNHNSEFAPEHLLDAILEDDGVDGIWERLGVQKSELLTMVEKALSELASVSGNSEPAPSRYISNAYQNALDYMGNISPWERGLVSSAIRSRKPALSSVRRQKRNQSTIFRLSSAEI